VNLRRLVILLITTALLSGLFLLGRLLIGYLHEDSVPSTTLLKHIQAAPLAWGYALVSSLLFFSFLILIPSQLPVWRIYTAFRQLDSSLLDNDPALSRGFYGEALAFRLQYGEKRFVQRIVQRFDFFYDYHNDALRWLNDIVNRTEHGTVPTEFILGSICSGQIGRIYSGACYGSGLTSNFVNEFDPLFLHARMDRIEIWSAHSAAPICILDRQQIELEQGQEFADYSCAYLNSLEKSTQQPVRLELRCMNRNSDKLNNDDSQVRKQMQILHTWITDLPSIVNQTSHANFGIDVTEIQEQEDSPAAPTESLPLSQQLQQLLGSHIDGFFTRATLPDIDSKIVPDAVILCGGLGVVAISENPISGTVNYSGDHNWTQIDTESHVFENLCLRAQQAKTALAKLLSEHGLGKWPVQCLVVFTHPEVTLNFVVGRQRAQCDVIKQAQLLNWFASQNTDATIRFTKDDYNHFISLLDPTRNQVEQAMQA
jgi:hypothetical protein